jgi:hypothetical protein
MDEQTWLTSSDPQAMLSFLRDSGKLTDRKARLFAVGCCRSFLPLLRDSRVGEILEVAERFADGLADDRERSAARKLAQQAAQVRGVVQHPEAPKWERRVASLAYYALARHASESGWNIESLAVEVLIWRAGGYDACDPRAIRRAVGASQADLLRDLFGPLPFRPLPPLERPVRAWNDGLIVKLATAIYEERAMPEGHLDSLRLSVLADMMEEANVTDQDILGHLRQQGAIHVRGCWCLDLLLSEAVHDSR